MSEADAHLIEEPHERRQLLRGNFLDVRGDTIRLPDGDLASREYIVHPGAVVVVPFLDDGRLVLERQYRYPLSQVLLEFPAGKIDPGESTCRCAERELAEETGYRAQEWAYAARMHNAPAYSTEFIEIWFARGLSLGERHLDHGELIDVVAMSEGELDRLAREGALTDAKTLISLMWLQKWRAGEWALNWRSAEDWSRCR
ncbi:NUDIX hydrolase [Ideonella sp. DXS29W]|uniref:GDP-mannose pyrophosphatase n=1 Tax=Ideonella lacteola TaxID=2984193 RepID=A0ABU9BTU0_9BURK